MIETRGENQTLQQLLARTPQGRAILQKLQGVEREAPEFMGAFLPGLKKVVKKIGKFTSPITTKIAKMAARVVGIPPSAIDSLARIDPTAANALKLQLSKTPTAQAVAPLLTPEQAPAGGFKIKPLHIGIAGGAAALIIVTILLLKKRK